MRKNRDQPIKVSYDGPSMNKGKPVIETYFCGVPMQYHADASLFLPESRTLLVSDLHLEKGNAQSKASPLPRFDTSEGIAKLSAAIARTNAKEVVFLGDSFHTNLQAFQLPDIFRQQLINLAKDRSFIWITGNHDPNLPEYLPGQIVPNYRASGLYFTHQIGQDEAKISGLICGHFHPKARISLKIRKISGRCFIQDETRIIMPAFGIFTGGLNILDPAIQRVLGERQIAYFCHAGKIYKLPVDEKIFLKS